MRICWHLKNTSLILLLTFMVSGIVSAKVASGLQNFASGMHQEQRVFNPLLCQEEAELVTKTCQVPLYNYFRHQDPETGRYISSDRIGLAGGLNTYGYALQNPLTYIDPNGLQVIPAPGPLPLPLPPVFIPGTPENQSFTESTIRGTNSISNFIQSFSKSAQDRCEEDCENQYNRDIAECQAASAMTGEKYTFVACKKQAERFLAGCLVDCDEDCN